MPNGEWAFIHEWIIYEYMMNKFNDGTLRLKVVVKNGQINLKSQYIKVKKLGNITNTDFPDIDLIELENDNFSRVAEVKFMTSKFNYHKKTYTNKSRYTYEDFLKANGCIIVLAHDEMPNKLSDKIDIFELEQEDFISFIKENLLRLINRQMHKSSYNKIWVMYQGPNFNKGTEYVKPAKESGKWCPTENLTGFELGIGDTILFIRTNGCRYQDLNTNKYYKWELNNIFICKVTSTIISREHYCQIKGIRSDTLLWYDETEEGKKDGKIRKRKGREKFRWNRVFEFKKEDEYSKLDLLIADMPSYLDNFKKICVEVFKNHISREISIEDCLHLFQYITKEKLIK